METPDIFNYKLQEKIYNCTSSDDDEILKEQIALFSKELIKRRKYIPSEGGLQAVMLISEDKFGAKINENNGEGTHHHSFINTIKFLNGDTNYVTPEGSARIYFIKKEYYQCFNECINIRIIDNDEKIDFIITSKCKKTSAFQNKVLKTLLDYWSSIKIAGIYKKIDVGMYLPEVEMESCLDWDNKYQEILSEVTEKSK